MNTSFLDHHFAIPTCLVLSVALNVYVALHRPILFFVLAFFITMVAFLAAASFASEMRIANPNNFIQIVGYGIAVFHGTVYFCDRLNRRPALWGWTPQPREKEDQAGEEVRRREE